MARRASLVLTLLWLGATALPQWATAANFIVNNAGSQDDGDPLAAGGNDSVCDILPSTAGDHCTLRAAIQEANDTPGADTITFASSITSITLTLPLPTATTPMTIDGANGSAVGSRVSINGGNTINGFDFGPSAQGSTLKNLVIHNFNDHGVALTGHGYTVENNFIGISPAGSAASRNTGDGINITGVAGPPANIPSLGLPSNLGNIATITADLILAFSTIPPNRIRNNVVSGNEGDGIDVFSENAAVNIISDNKIGTSATGLASIPNGAAGGVHHGVLINSFAYANVVGPGNLISGNTVDPDSHGVALMAGAVRYPNFVSGNIIGPSSSIVAGLGNSASGIFVDTRPQTSAAPNNTTNLAALIGPGNVIGYNGNASALPGPDLQGSVDAGVLIAGNSARVRVHGNLIGIGENPSSAGSFVDLGNHGDGVVVTTADHIIGGTLPALANVISHNDRHSLSVRGDSIHSLQIIGNLIGRNPSNLGMAPNGSDGIRIFQSSGVSIGGTGSDEGNTIAGNTRHGIKIGSSSSGSSNLIARNRIWGNGDLGIDLDRVINDPDPIPDPLGQDPNLNYANLGQNQPEVCDGNSIPACTVPSYNSATGATSFSWRLESAPNTPYTIEVFASDTPDASGAGEGQYFLGSFNVTTDGAAQASGTQSITPAVPVDTRGRWISLTARPTHTIDPPGPATSGPANHSSEFSQATKVPSAGVLQYSLSSFSVGEAGGTATITVSRSSGTDGAVSVSFATANGTAIQPGDYGSRSGTLNWAAGDGSNKTFTVPIVSDSIDEFDETVQLILSSPGGGAVLGAQNTSLLTITDDDAAPTISIGDVSLPEGLAGTTTAFNFTVSLSAASGKTVGFSANTVNGTATVGSDYVQLPVTSFSFSPGQTTRTVTVTVTGDDVIEPTEVFFVNLSAPSNATLADSQGAGTIISDEIANVSISDASKAEGNSGLSQMAFSMTRSNGTTTGSVTVTVTGGSATAGVDFVAPAPFVVTFAIGETSKTVNIILFGDSIYELNEQFTLSLSNPVNLALNDALATGTISNDDPLPSIGITDVSQSEGQSGTTNFSFFVVLSDPSSQTVSVSASTADQTATLGNSDYQALPATLLDFQPGETSRQVVVKVNGDATNEINEVFQVNLSNVSNANLIDAQGLGTILNDDGPLLFQNSFE